MIIKDERGTVKYSVKITRKSSEPGYARPLNKIVQYKS